MYETFDLGHIKMYVSDDHRFGTDAFLLASYAGVRKDSVVCDLCTGCGIIPLIFGKNGRAAKIYAVDIQEEAVELLKKQLRKTVLRIKFSLFCAICANFRRIKSRLSARIS